MCSTRGGSQGMYTTFASAKANMAKPTLALKPRGDVTRNPKQGYQWPPKIVRVNVSAKKKNFYKKINQKNKENLKKERKNAIQNSITYQDKGGHSVHLGGGGVVSQNAL